METIETVAEIIAKATKETNWALRCPGKDTHWHGHAMCVDYDHELYPGLRLVTLVQSYDTLTSAVSYEAPMFVLVNPATGQAGCLNGIIYKRGEPGTIVPCLKVSSADIEAVLEADKEAIRAEARAIMEQTVPEPRIWESLELQEKRAARGVFDDEFAHQAGILKSRDTMLLLCQDTNPESVFDDDWECYLSIVKQAVQRELNANPEKAERIAVSRFHGNDEVQRLVAECATSQRDWICGSMARAKKRAADVAANLEWIAEKGGPDCVNAVMAARAVASAPGASVRVTGADGASKSLKMKDPYRFVDFVCDPKESLFPVARVTYRKKVLWEAA